MGKTFRKTKIPPGEFNVTISKNSLIYNQTVTSMRNLTTTWPIPKYQPTVKLLFQYLIGLDLVAAFFPLLYKSPISD